MKTTTAQNMIATSLAAFTFIGDEAASFSAPNKGGDVTKASKREVMDAAHNFIEKYRYAKVEQEQPVMIEETSETGEVTLVDSGEVETVIVEIDRFGDEVNAVLALRLDTVRANSATAKVKSLEAELAELKALLAAKG